jgi:hypothetical protein
MRPAAHRIVIDANEHTPRSAAALLSNALGHLDLIEPPAAREPIRLMFRATIEQCTVSATLWGQPVRYVLELAQALVDASRSR